MSGNNSVDRILFGIARPVGLLDTHEHMAECKPARILLSCRDSNLQGAGWKKSGWIAITPSRLSRLCRLFRGLSCGLVIIDSLKRRGVVSLATKLLIEGGAPCV